MIHTLSDRIPVASRYRLRRVAGVTPFDIEDWLGISIDRLLAWEAGETQLLHSEVRSILIELSARSRRVSAELKRLLGPKPSAKVRARASLHAHRRPTFLAAVRIAGG